jgi:hypothetical protein
LQSRPESSSLEFEEKPYMKKYLGIIAGIVALSLGCVSVCSAGDEPANVKNLAEITLSKLGSDPVIVAAVKAENGKKKTLDQIKKDDKIWCATPGLNPFMKAIQNNACSDYLRTIQKSAAYYYEIFVMDNLGANVAMTDKTSDYWQGDEDKFIKSYNGGNGTIFIDKVKFDDSTQAYLVQVSVPVKDGGKTIGVITIGINVDKLK